MAFDHIFMLDKQISVEFYLIDAFEIFHFMPIYYLFQKKGFDAKFVAESPDYNTSGKWFDYEQAIEILEMNQVRYVKECNPDCDFAFTTQDAKLLCKYKKKKIHTTYGFGFANYSFGESKQTLNGFDYKLVHGRYTYNKLLNKENIIKIYIMGYPKHMWDYPVIYKDSFNVVDEVRRKNIGMKPVLVYFPTWDKGSSISWYWKEMLKLKEKFFVITKAHHCTFRLKSEQENRDILYKISDIVCEGNADFSTIAKIGDIAVCDAISGAASETSLINEEIDLLLLYSPMSEKNDFKIEIQEFAYCVKKPEELVEACDAVYGHDHYKKRRKELLKEIFESTDDTCLDDFLDALRQKERD